MDEILYLKMCLRAPIRAWDLAGIARTYIRQSSLSDRLEEEFDDFLCEVEPVLPCWDEILAGGYPWDQLTSWSEFRACAYRDLAAFGHPSWPRGRLFIWHPDLGGRHARALSTAFAEALISAENAFRVARGLPAIGQGWLSEAALLQLVRRRCPDATPQWSPFWLGGQRVDIYVPSLNLAIEYQGEQHYRPVALFGGQEGLEATQARDERKRRLLARHSVRLLEWRFDRPVTETELDRALTDLE